MNHFIMEYTVALRLLSLLLSFILFLSPTSIFSPVQGTHVNLSSLMGLLRLTL